MASASFAGRVKPEIKYGLISGVALCLWIALEYVLGFHTTRPDIGAYTGLLSNLIPVITLLRLLQSKRAGIYDGRLSLGAGIFAGMLASFVASLLVYSCINSYTQLFNPSWIYQALEVKVAAWRAQHVTEPEIRSRITAYLAAYTPRGLLQTVILNMTLMGGLISLVLTFVVRRLPHQAT